jgi:ribonuclease P protein subunit RPR2
VRHHHERWDGGGYPDGLQKTEIPLGARVFAVADALDAMTSDRPYRRARSWEEATAEIVREAGRQFDPHVVEAFQGRSNRLRRIHYELAAK